MIRGISFMVPNKRSPVLYLITKNIDVKKFFWVLIADDVHKRSGGYFLKDRYPGSEFERIIKDEDCYAVFIYLQAYRKEDEIVDIYNYEEFLKSKCELLLFIDDNIYIDIYAKDIKLIEKIKKNAEINDFKNINYITDENDVFIDYHSMT